MAFQKEDFPGNFPDRLLQDPRICRLMAQLEALGPDVMQQAADLAAAGRTDDARRLLQTALGMEGGPDHG